MEVTGCEEVGCVAVCKQESEVDTMKKRGKTGIVRLLAVAMPLALLLGACALTGSSASPSAGAVTKVKVVPDWTSAWVGWVPWVGAEKKGWFDEAGIDMEIVLPPGGSDPPRLVSTGAGDLAVSIGGDLLFAASQGLESTAVASLADRIPEGIACWADEVTKPEDLYGKTVAIYNFPSAQLYWKFFTEHHKLDTSKIEVVDEGNDGVPLILSGTVDCIDAAASGELVSMELESGRKATYFIYDDSNGVPKIQNSILSANKDFLAKNPDVVKAWIGVWFRAVDYMLENEQNLQEFVDAYIEAYPENEEEPTKTGIQQMVKYAYPPYYPDQPQGWISPEGWTALHDILVDTKQIEAAIEDPTHLISNDHLPSQ